MVVRRGGMASAVEAMHTAVARVSVARVVIEPMPCSRQGLGRATEDFPYQVMKDDIPDTLT